MFSVNERPSLDAIEFAHTHTIDCRRIKVAGIDAQFCSGLGVERFPMRGAAADLAMHRADCAWAPDVFGCALWMAMEYDGLRFIESPEGPISPANRAVAFDEVLGLLSDADPDSAAVT
jgi:hypothetical protein